MKETEFNYVPDEGDEQAIAKGGVAVPFPWRLHEMLKVAEDERNEDIVSWAPHGRAFTVHKPKAFADRVLTRFFSQTKYPSFQRQLNLYGFKRFAHGKDKGAYYHFCFVKGHPNLVRCMTRVKVKGNKVRSKPTEEPDFYNPLWKNHFGTTVPSELKAKAFHKVDATPVHKSVTQPFPLATFSTEADTRGTNLNGTPYVDILPAPTESAESIAPVSDEESSWDSIDLEALGGDLLFFDGNPFHFEERDDPYFTVDGEADPIGSFFVDQVSAGMAP